MAAATRCAASGGSLTRTTFAARWRVGFEHWRGSVYARRSLVAGETRDLQTAFKMPLVDRQRHCDHLTRVLLGLLVVELVLVADVTEVALNAQRRGDELHGRLHLFGGDAFQLDDILVNLLSRFDFGRLCHSEHGSEGGDDGQARNSILHLKTLS
jgi:hypothetical protein